MSYWNGIRPMQTEHDAWLDMTPEEEREYSDFWDEPKEESDDEPEDTSADL